jgi:hypothetical protein
MVIDKMMDHCVIVIYDNHYYMVCKFQNKGDEKLFVVDYEDYSTLMRINKSWHQVNNYIGCFLNDDNGVRFVQYAHNAIMDFQPTGKGSKMTVDHINRYGFDNRKANLRIVSQTVQNENQNKRKRTVTLPKGCGIRPDEIPRSMWYDSNRDRFVIEIKQNGQTIVEEKQDGKREYRLRLRFEMAKKRLIEICDEKPELVEHKHLLQNFSEGALELMREYNEIISATDFECINDCLIEVPKKMMVKINYNKLTKDEIKILEQPRVPGSKKGNRLPPGCGVTPDMIPKYCRYVPATDKKGDHFIIERHPDLPSGIRSIMTKMCRDWTTLEKHGQLMKILDELKVAKETGKPFEKKTYKKKPKTQKKSKKNTTNKPKKTQGTPKKKYSGSKSQKKR